MMKIVAVAVFGIFGIFCSALWAQNGANLQNNANQSNLTQDSRNLNAMRFAQNSTNQANPNAFKLAQNGTNRANPNAFKLAQNGANLNNTTLPQTQTPQNTPLAQPRPIVPQRTQPNLTQDSTLLPSQKPTLTQQPLIVEYAIFKEVEKICGGSDYMRIECLVSNLRHFSNRIYTKISGQKGQFSIIFYALDSSGKITYPREINNKFCEFRDTLGRRFFSKLQDGGFSYVVEYPFSASSSKNKAYISCGFMLFKQQITQTSQPISVIPHSFDINFSIKNATGGIVNLPASVGANPHNMDANRPNLPQNLSANPNESPLNDSDILVLKAQNNAIQIAPNATARNLNGEIDKGFSENLVPLYVRFSRDGGLCNAVGENIQGIVRFKNGRLVGNSLNVNFDDVATGEVEIALTNRLDAKDRADGKCLIENINSVESNANQTNQTTDSAQNSVDSNANPQKIQSANIENIGKIPCQKPIIIRKRVDLVPHSIYATLENNGRWAYYNQHTYIPAIAHLPFAKISLQALNHQNRPLKNFTNNCYGRDLSVKLDDNANNFVFINENMPDSIIPKASFLDSSLSRVVRKISATGIKDRDLTPIDLFNARVVNLNDAFLGIDFVNLGAKYPRYLVKPKITNDWRIALLRGRIALLPNSNENKSLIANPKINYEFYCKYPTCKVVDIESVISPTARLPKGSANDWFVNTLHPSDLKVAENQLSFGENAQISVYSIGSVANGVQTLALQSTAKGEFGVKIRQSYNANDFAQFLYFSPSFENIRENLGVEAKVKF